MDVLTMLTLEPHGPDVFVGVGPSYPWGGLYGGQIVAQALRAAAETVPADFRPHSLHAYFIRRGDAAEPIRFEVDRIRNGKSFVTRRVVARQAIGAILGLSASFQVDEEGAAAQAVVPPTVGAPEDADDSSWTTMFQRRWVVGSGDPRSAEPSAGAGKAIAWMRANGDGLGDDPVVQACVLAYLSDDLPTDAVVALHPQRATSADPGTGEATSWFSASLDHAIWFHRPAAADAWQLHDFTCHALIGSRGLALGHVFGADGAHLATVTQEVLLRSGRSAPSG